MAHLMVVEYELVDLTLFQVNTAWTKQALKLLKYMENACWHED